MTRTLRRALLAGLLLAPFAATPAMAQSPTLEGTTITNTASASWTDANGNTYTPATASVSVTVGFKAGPDVVSAATATPSSPSPANELPFTITNGGNGVDQFSVSTTAGAGVTITGYKVNGTTYATLAELNAALAAINVNPANAPAAAGNVVVTVVYTVAPGQGGQTIPVSLTATSVRTTSVSDDASTNVQPAVAGAVNVTPDAGSTNRLPSGTGPTTYTETYTVQNTGNASDTYNLALTTTGGATVSIVSVNGTAGTGSSVTVAAGGNATISVVYTVSNSAVAGTTADLVLTATSANTASQSDSGTRTVRVIRATISMTKEVFEDNQTTAAATVVPQQYIQYRITITNTGEAPATLTGSSYGVTDALPSQVSYVSASGDAAGWQITETAGTVTAKLDGTLAPSASRHFWIRVRVK